MPRTPQADASKGLAPFPTRQMTILALCRICEPIAFMSIFPYIYNMIKSFGDQQADESEETKRKIAIYAGLVTSAFAFAEFSSGVVWGKLSDKIGRKPVLLFGLFGTALSMLIFGFAPSLPVALLARALGGLLNGNIGVLQTTVAEMITVKEHQPRAYTVMPFVWCVGSILGPILGSAFANPSDEHSFMQKTFLAGLFKGAIWEKFRYLLPNLVITCIVLCGVVVGILFLEETHAEKKHRRDPGLEAGQWIIRKFCPCADNKGFEKKTDPDELISLLGDNEDEQPPGYRTNDGSPRLPSSTPSPEPQDVLDLNASDVFSRPKPATTKAFTRQVVLNIVSYGILAYHTMTFDSMLPTHLSAGVDNPQHVKMGELPFKFVSSYSLPETAVGAVLSFQGLYSMIATVFIFPIVCRRLGALKLFRTISILYPVLYFATPYFALLPDSMSKAGIYLLVIWKCTFATMAYPSNAILLTNSAPSLLMLGTINGVAASTASLARAFGPFIAGVLFSTGLQKGYSGLAWWCSAFIAVIGAIVSLYMSDKGGRLEHDDEKSDEEDEEAAFEDHILDHTALEHGVTSPESTCPSSTPDHEDDSHTHKTFSI